MEKAPLMKSTSGIRGIVGKSLTPENIVHYAAAFGRFLKQGKVVVGRDSRPSGAYFSHLVCSTLAMVGCKVVDIGIVPTPTVELAVTHHKAAGGIAITASHNPLEWNALKFFSSLGEFITKAQYEQLEKIASGKSIQYAAFDGLGSIEYDNHAIERHIASVMKLKSISIPKIRRGRFTVVVDAINGAGSSALPTLLERMGVMVIRLNCKGDGDFFRKPEPVPENLRQLGRMVKRHKAHIGMACDPDADRLALVDETGKPIGEEQTLGLAVGYYLKKKKGPVAINLSTSRATADVAEAAGSTVYYSPVGEANVIAEMRARNAVIGGEGNGGVILPESHYGRDALVAAVLTLAHMAEAKMSVSALVGTIPTYVNIKKKAPLPAGFERKILQVKKKITAEYGKIKVDRRDGLRFDLEEGWIQVRKSNTEPIYRLIVEARTNKLADSYVSLVRKTLK
ncbi:MAG: phosphoglucosamine mutase [Candidatus Zixiibacteriota bacterium]